MHYFSCVLLHHFYVCMCVYILLVQWQVFFPLSFTPFFSAFSPAYVHLICHDAIAVCGVWFASILCLVWFSTKWNADLRFTPMYFFSIICYVLVFVDLMWSRFCLIRMYRCLYYTAHHSKWSNTLYTLFFDFATIWDTNASLCWYLSTSSAPLHAYLHSKHTSMHSLRFSIVLYYFQACARRRFRKHLFSRHTQHTCIQGPVSIFCLCDSFHLNRCVPVQSSYPF